MIRLNACNDSVDPDSFDAFVDCWSMESKSVLSKEVMLCYDAAAGLQSGRF